MRKKRRSEFERAFEILIEECENEKCGDKLKGMMQCRCGHDVFRRWLVEIAGDLVLLPNASMWTVTLKKDMLSVGNLKDFDLKNSKRRISRIINKQQIDGLQAIGFLDIELQEKTDPNDSRSNQWLMHYHFIVLSNLRLEKLRRIMKNRFKRISPDNRPLFIKEIDISRPFNFGYLLKYPWELKKKVRDYSGNQNSEQMEIKGESRRELNAFLCTSPLIKWIFLIGLRRASGMLIDISRSGK